MDLCVRLLPVDSFPKKNMMISGKHGRFVRGGGRWSVVDEGARNGISVNRTKLAPDTPRVLEDGDEISVGGALILDCEVQESGSAMLTRRENRRDLVAALIVDALRIREPEDGEGLELGILRFADDRFWWQPAPASQIVADGVVHPPNRALAMRRDVPYAAGDWTLTLSAFTFEIFR